MTPKDDFTMTVDAAAAYERWHYDPPPDERPTRLELLRDEGPDEKWSRWRR